MASKAYIEVDHGPGRQPVRFSDPRSVITAREASDVEAALNALDAALAAGAWIAGYATYELGYVLEPRLAPLLPVRRDLPLLEFGIFDAPGPAQPATPGGTLGGFTPGWSPPDYVAACGTVLDYIRAGDIYQANLTMPLHGTWEGDPAALQAALAAVQPVGHGALVDMPGAVILSRSPELFFRLDGAGGIEAAPMKGTAPRDVDPVRDRALRNAIADDPKSRAENLMIVDLLRNDIGRVARLGSVEVPSLFALETYATVHQMVSRVTGRLAPDVQFSRILRALFPCGSITGAPKIRAMEILRALEPEPRGVYCGAIGWASPDGRADFSVAIRGLTLYPDGRATLNVGGGIVVDSSPEAEFEEALWKARFADLTRPPSG